MLNENYKAFIEHHKESKISKAELIQELFEYFERTGRNILDYDYRIAISTITSAENVERIELIAIKKERDQ